MPSEYELRAWEDLQRRRDEFLTSRARKLVPKSVRDRAAAVSRGVRERVDDIPLPEDAIELMTGLLDGAMQGLSSATSASLRTHAILADYRERGLEVPDVAAIRRLDLQAIDQVKPRIDIPYLVTGAATGASAGLAISGAELAALFGAGAGGAAGGAVTVGPGVAPGAGAGAAPGMGVVFTAMAVDAAVVLAASMRLTFHIASYYGFDASRPEERLRGLGVLNVTTASTELGKQRAYAELNKLVGMIVRNATWAKLNENAITKIITKAFEFIGLRLTKQRLATLMPVAGIVIGATLNLRTLTKVADGADLLYREQFLRGKGCGGEVWEPPRYDAETSADEDGEVEDVPLTEIIEEALAQQTSPEPPETEFVLQFDPAHIEDLAARFSYSDDEEQLAAGAGARARGYLTREELRLICRWKTPRSVTRVARNSAAETEVSDSRRAGTRVARSQAARDDLLGCVLASIPARMPRAG